MVPHIRVKASSIYALSRPPCPFPVNEYITQGLVKSQAGPTKHHLYLFTWYLLQYPSSSCPDPRPLVPVKDYILGTGEVMSGQCVPEVNVP